MQTTGNNFGFENYIHCSLTRCGGVILSNSQARSKKRKTGLRSPMSESSSKTVSDNVCLYVCPLVSISDLVAALGFYKLHECGLVCQLRRKKKKSLSHERILCLVVASQLCNLREAVFS